MYNLLPGFQDTSRWEAFLVRNQTPPYITAEPEITHWCLDEPSADTPSRPRFLVLASDGFTDISDGEGLETIISDWATHMVDNMTKVAQTSSPEYAISVSPLTPTPSGAESRNMALRLLRRALGGEDRRQVSRVLTLDMDMAWIDDTSIVVQTL